MLPRLPRGDGSRPTTKGGSRGCWPPFDSDPGMWDVNGERFEFMDADWGAALGPLVVDTRILAVGKLFQVLIRSLVSGLLGMVGETIEGWQGWVAGQPTMSA